MQNADTPHVPSAAETADGLTKSYLAGGSDAAYASFKQEYDAASKMCNRDQYFQEVAKDLQATGQMPNIAVGWLKAEKGHLADENGVINKQGIVAAESHGGLDAIFGDVVLTSVPGPDKHRTFFDQIANTKKVWSDSPDGIEDADLRKYTRQMHRADRRDFNQEETRQAADPLFRNNGELLAALDTGPHGERNGVITGHEMKRFLDEYKEHPGVGVYTEENAKYVHDLLHNDVGLVTKHGHHGFIVEDLMRKAGINEDDLTPRPQPEVMKPEAPHKPGDGCDVPTAPKDQPVPPKGDQPPRGDHAHKAEVNVDLEVRKAVDLLSRVQPNEGYNAVAARLLDIHPGHIRTAEEKQEIKTLGLEIQKMNGDQSTLHLRTGVVLPVSANLELLMLENPALKASIEKMKANLSKPPAAPQSDADLDWQPNC